jgi:O-antigen/teichoic acid export membrane protein
MSEPGATSATNKISDANPRRIGKNVAALSAGLLVNKAIALVTYAYLARSIGPMTFGQYAAAMGFASLFTVIADAGLVYVLIRDLAQHPERLREYFINTFILKTILIALLAAVTWVSAAAFHYPANLRPLIVVASLFIGVSSFSSLWTGVFRAWERMELEAIFQSIESVLTLVSTVAILHAKGSIMQVLFGRIAVSAFVCLLAFGFIQRREKMRWSLNLKLIRFLLAEGAPFALVAASWQIYARLNVVWLAKSADSATVAFYQSAISIVELPILMLPMIFNRSLFPVFSRLRDKPEMIPILRGGLKLLWLSLVPILIAFIGWAPVLIHAVFGAAYAQSAPLLRIIAISLLFTYPSTVLGTYLGATGRQKINVVISLVGLITLPLLNMLLIPHFGVRGAAFAFVSTEIFGVVLCLTAVRRIIKEPLAFDEWRRFWLVNIFMLPLVLLIPKSIFTLSAALLIYGAALLAGRVITRRETDLVVSYVKRRLKYLRLSGGRPRG